MKTFTISGIPYNFPESGQEPPYGELITDWAEAITNVLSTLSGDYDILQTSLILLPNQTAANIIGVSFDPEYVQGFIAEYSINRTIKDDDDVIESEYVECGTIHGSRFPDENTWHMTISGNNIGETGVDLDITQAGQFVYTSSLLSVPVAGSDTIRIVFSARAFASS